MTKCPVARSAKMLTADTRKKMMVHAPVRSDAVATSTSRMPPLTSTATCESGAPAWPGVTPAQNMSTNSEMIAVRAPQLLGEDAAEDEDAQAAAHSLLQGQHGGHHQPTPA